MAVNCGSLLSSLLVGVSLCGLGNSLQCDSDFYWDASGRICRPCSRCPRNLIIRTPCGEHSDTVCGPFREFLFFNQHDNVDLSFPSLPYDTDSDSGTASEEENSDERVRQYPKKTAVGGLQNEPMIEKDDGEYWKNLAFALIGVVCVLIFVATVVVLMACRKLHETAALKRPDEDEDDDSGYVVIRAIRPAPNRLLRPPPSDFTPSPAAASLLAAEESGDVPCCNSQGQRQLQLDQRCKGIYRPKRRLLNYDADDVFESEDSAGSRTSRKTPLQAIPEKSVSDSGSQCNNAEQV
ncbi:hypothetical protein BaRGS_00036638 [Batillaria attramentaria]|uniref:TNFR-Cys domain-containing protein n=1 Tax=Batillaria attramentaria TaxID=370345 RepID=A0ABD0JCJ7_9CAEN